MTLVRAGTPAEWATWVAERVIERVRQTPALTLCLPTGLTPLPIYDRLADAVRTGRVSFAQAVVVLLDEFGGVAAEDPGRCDQTLQRFLLDRIDLPPGRFHRFDLSGDLDAACRAHEAAVGTGCDLALLGVGVNGHIGMNEPGTPADTLTRRVALAPETTAAAARYFSHDGLPTWGVTMGIGTIRRSREVLVLASGPAKAPIARRIVEGPVTPDVPATLLRDHDNAQLVLDENAAGELPVDASFG
jgi:glucosamine-6-phosphate isomerase